jgi:translation initiation factor IF-3
MKNDEENFKERTRDRQVRLIDEDGAALGIVLTAQALQIAKEKGLDLFMIQPEANPPVARIMDYGKFKFEQQKRAHEARKKQHVVDVKQIKMRYEIDDNDYQVKLRKAREFLSRGDRIKLVIALRGREIKHADLAIALVNRFADELEDRVIIDKEPVLEGKSVIMTLGPAIHKGGN